MSIACQINGQAREWAEAPTIHAMLEALGLDARQVAVERNGAIVPRSAHGEQRLESGDTIEIVRFIGGG